ncbi:FAD-dependent oxidoreductase [Streptomyces tropicalis]|uniref:FAD-dependent oxidoreductase n=1 Tax=Streptomyces tropicalis TaxID=3034234 RepID=A0ABT6A654_9ACTN|nr:FAD-dependent oxidoreductase [Streptomyces tropicalis]MDF3300114.1 FAD-dependent oxidoreductase [Streptomyces tropicalis]
MGPLGAFDFHSHTQPKPVCYAVAFDPDGWKRVSNDLVRESGVNLRLHNWFSRPVVQDGAVRGGVCETKSGPQAVMGDVVIDTTGDIDVASRAGAPYAQDNYLVTLVFRLGGVDTTAAERFEQANPREARAINRKIKRMLGGAWELWWLKTPVPGVVWCNCPHMAGFDGTDPVSLTEAEFEARARIGAVLDHIKSDLPGFQDAYLLDVAEQMGVRQTRLLQGEYVVTKDDVTSGRHFTDSVARGRDYYTPYRALLPRGVDQLLVAGTRIRRRGSPAGPNGARTAELRGSCRPRQPSSITGSTRVVSCQRHLKCMYAISHTTARRTDTTTGRLTRRHAVRRSACRTRIRPPQPYLLRTPSELGGEACSQQSCRGSNPRRPTDAGSHCPPSRPY